jgi:hypothetical protein
VARKRVNVDAIGRLEMKRARRSDRLQGSVGHLTRQTKPRFTVRRVCRYEAF